jgi:hypothetical protein
MKARPRFTQRRWARTRSEIAPTTSPINSPSLPARHDRAQLDGGSSMSCFRIRRLTTLPQHVDRGPQRCASLDGMYSISSCSKGLSAAPYFLVAGSPTGTSAIGEPTVLAGCRAPSLNSKCAATFGRQVRRRFALTRNMPARWRASMARGPRFSAAHDGTRCWRGRRLQCCQRFDRTLKRGSWQASPSAPPTSAEPAGRARRGPSGQPICRAARDRSRCCKRAAVAETHQPAANPARPW